MHLITRKYQYGVSLIAAIVLLLALSLLGAMIAVLTSIQSESTVNEWFSAQALYAAESGVQASAFLINNNPALTAAATCNAADTGAAVQLEAGRAAWYSVNATATTISGYSLCTIVATGMAGGTSGSPIATRQITVQYRSIVIP